MRALSVVALAISVSGCGALTDQPELVICEEYILANIENPESYKRGQYDSLNVGDYWQVGIEYSYEEAPGQMSERKSQVCDFEIVNGKPDISRFLDLDPVL